MRLLSERGETTTPFGETKVPLRGLTLYDYLVKITQAESAGVIITIGYVD
jgi:hypothetical protein